MYPCSIHFFADVPDWIARVAWMQSLSDTKPAIDGKASCQWHGRTIRYTLNVCQEYWLRNLSRVANFYWLNQNFQGLTRKITPSVKFAQFSLEWVCIWVDKWTQNGNPSFWIFCQKCPDLLVVLRKNWKFWESLWRNSFDRFHVWDTDWEKNLIFFVF